MKNTAFLLAGVALAAIGFASSQGGGQGGSSAQQRPFLPPASGGASADSNNRMIAVTGVDITGASILYLVDTVGMQLAVYQASGGTESTQGLKFVGARRIDLDLQLDGYNDKSEYTYKRLRGEFSKSGLLPGSPPSPGGEAATGGQ